MKYNENGIIDYEEFNNPLEKPEPLREDYSDKADNVQGCGKPLKDGKGAVWTNCGIMGLCDDCKKKGAKA